LALREQQKRNLLASLVLSQGTPMILAGDEFGRTQQGNNNAYCQDNEISWIDWSHLSDAHAANLLEFTKSLVGLRKQYPILRRNRFLSGLWNERLGLKDATWIDPSGVEMKDGDWAISTARCFGVILDGRAPISGIGRKGSDVTLLLIANAHYEPVKFKIPPTTGGKQWDPILGTNKLMPGKGKPQTTLKCGDVAGVPGRWKTHMTTHKQFSTIRRSSFVGSGPGAGFATGELVATRFCRLCSRHTPSSAVHCSLMSRSYRHARSSAAPAETRQTGSLDGANRLALLPGQPDLAAHDLPTLWA
jgi:isoamylase